MSTKTIGKNDKFMLYVILRELMSCNAFLFGIPEKDFSKLCPNSSKSTAATRRILLNVQREEFQ